MLKKALYSFLIVGLCIAIYFYTFYVRVDSSLVKAYQEKNTSYLQNYFKDSKNNWYQKARSIEFYSILRCKGDDSFISDILSSQVHQDRLAVFEGCFSKEDVDFLVSRGLSDRYSYVRYTTLKYIEKRHIEDIYQDELTNILKIDSSTMVKNQAQALIKIQ